MKKITAPKGTDDILPDDIYRWQWIEAKAREVAERYGYREIRFPIFEHTELFTRGIGEATEIVEKEMYTFPDRSGRSLTLRPEGTASVARAFVEKINPGTLWKVYYLGPMFRYERPQGGRFRQFYQMGVEAIGSAAPALDAEVISLAVDFFQNLGLRNLMVEMNSIGCCKCRPVYKETLKSFFKDKLSSLCNDCQRRFQRNILRILDCKRDECRKISADSPSVLEHLCLECREHFKSVQKHLELIGLKYRLNPFIVRGLDYYTRSVFEIVSEHLGAQSALCGGGRYDDLIEELGGQPTPAVGWALGMERTIMVLEREGVSIPRPRLKAFIIAIGKEAEGRAEKLLYRLRRNGFSADRDFQGKSLKGQMKQADRLEADFALIIGEDEIKNDVVSIRNMLTGEQKQVKLELVENELKR